MAAVGGIDKHRKGRPSDLGCVFFFCVFQGLLHRGGPAEEAAHRQVPQALGQPRRDEFGRGAFKNEFLPSSKGTGEKLMGGRLGGQGQLEMGPAD